MSNVSRSNGFQPLRHLFGLPFASCVTRVFAPASSSDAIFIGDLVEVIVNPSTEGTIHRGKDISGFLHVQRSTSIEFSTLGVVVGVQSTPEALHLKHRPASTAAFLDVLTDQNIVYEIEEDALVTPITYTGIGLNFGLTFTAGSTITGLSDIKIDSDSVSTSNTVAVKVLKLVDRKDNDFNKEGAGSDPGRFEVMFNRPLYLNHTKTGVS